MQFRIGQGLDIHPFTEHKPLVLGGVLIPNHKGLEGHSDADALTHAICDALLGAANLGDIGEHFPDTNPEFKNKDSLFFLDKVGEMISARGWQIQNLDSTILTETPKIKPYVPSMQEKIATSLKLEKNQVSIKATRPEKLGAYGRGEGLLVMSVALLFKK